MEGSGKKTRGRQKIEIKRIEDNETRLVTFSKRKTGILKKACELANRCGAAVGAVIFSPTGKPFAFGSPSIEAVTNRFLGVNRQTEDPRITSIMEAQQQSRLQNLNDRHNELLLKLQAAKEKNKSLKQITEAIKRGNATDNVVPEWWEVPFDESSPAELEGMAVRMDQFYECICSYQAEGAGSSSAVQPANGAVVDRVDLPGAP